MSLWKQLQQTDKKNCRMIGKNFELQNWSLLNTEEKKHLVLELVSFLSARLEIKDEPKIAYKQLAFNNPGYYDGLRAEISINHNSLNFGILTAVTVAHELRHHYQYEKTKDVSKVKWLSKLRILFFKNPVEARISYWLANPKSEPVEEWDLNFANYIRGETKTPNPNETLEDIVLGGELEEYKNQPIEEDAFRYEGIFMNQFFID
ncbi:hypothetical protein O0Q50_19200 [Priestia aryabhattai]|uniref:DUF2268 domain-containing protein n=1 Tax=Priestia aryabhattai TaxID=412384 RepID=A0AAX6NBM3_PRIAR|nr:hypothetical protein [Priestia aryabhattai]MDU9693301.1 hypothetical protein [Priestia aryabhattai]